MNLQRLSFAGAGRVGSALCRGLFDAGYRIDLIVTQTEGSGTILSEQCNASWSSRLIFPDSSDVIIVSVPDNRLREVLNNIRCGGAVLVVHTAGSQGIEVFPDHINRKGVFYPLQTFSPGREVSFKNLPFLLEASDDQSASILKSMVDSVGGMGYFVETERRRMLHLAAVFVCNFTNHMLTMGKEIAGKAGFNFEILDSLLNETISKAMRIGPENSQTGPAMRNDQNTIEKHLELLSFSPELQKIYYEMTESIIKYYKKS
jgi:predicted short-subunit dehydrogenase-like oxidoreductase (DUF2520 family)